MIESISTTRDGRGRTKWFGFFFFAVITSLFALRTIKHSNHQAAREVCRLLRENYFRASEPDVREFLARCDHEAENEPWTFSRKEEIARINRRLSGLKTSHLSVYTPVENKQLWENERLDTGMRVRRIDGELVVYRLLPESPAVRADIKLGDAILTLNGEGVIEDDIATRAGIYKVARGPKIFSVEVEVEDISEDLGPRLTKLSDGVGLLSIGSFLPQYFDGERWRAIVAKLREHRALVIDVRANAGGSFVGALRGLSPFFCKSALVGRLWTRAEGAGSGEPGALPDDLRASPQLEALEESGAVLLKSFDGYGCYDKSVVVLVDDGTSSVAEIFSEAFLSRPSSHVWGTPTAGQVVMAKWFEIGSLGGGDFAMAIPIAGYQTREGKVLERRGVAPQKVLSYDLESALQGRDSWISEAFRFVSK